MTASVPYTLLKANIEGIICFGQLHFGFTSSCFSPYCDICKENISILELTLLLHPTLNLLKVKVTLKQDMKAHRGSRGVVLLFV
jgi:hypothetical protein